ncbi:biotin--[acetyl-CoA-carboxylase] ligase [Pelomonas sp. APW6]|uniref:Biotin--[acetyl-CoA-carboxylase] ligase n=1 Tax=Roseateles subflavus TaxID=3053353 RepID=A0ABT7LE80_9BURK|nr:biotin--[acetyl-CoA-carboxylase] ligase [Pelomonas sp. APW6]MDL5031163.1 biotin--[acetyl-CoA-carboxylase] ligase [Pelomonas sp. APW6]
MAVNHQNWGAESLWQDLEPLLPGLSIEVLARTDSTNSVLLERVRSEQRSTSDRGAERPPERGQERGIDRHDTPRFGRRAHDMQPCLLVAEHQTAGRGRMGRIWHAEAGASLTFSLALPLALPDWSGLSLAVGCAMAEALEPAPAAAPRLQLKWPNDLWLDGRKLGGILIETVSAGEQRIAVIGVGLNIRPQHPGNESQFMSGYASLDELDASLSAPEVLRRVARPLILAVTGFAQGGFGAWQQRYQARDLLRGRPISAAGAEGLGAGVSAQGELLMDVRGQRQVVSAGEVSVRLQASEPPAC